MPSHAPSRTHFRKTLLASLIGAALAPHAAMALDFAQKPPGTADPYVAPNVILSLDDSTSMDERDMVKVNGKYTKTRVQVLQEALEVVFSDKSLIPDGKLRLAWQSLGNCTSVDNLTFGTLGTAAASTTTANTMRVLDGDHRANFLKYAKNYATCTSTPTHKMVKRADEYMRAPLHKNGPWASKPGETLLEGEQKKPLGCRRNYHILLTDGGWNGNYYGPEETYFDSDSPYRYYGVSAANREDINTDPINFDNQDSKPFMAYGLKAATPAKSGTGQLPDKLGIDPREDPKEYPGFNLPDGKPYSRDDPNTWIYRDIDYLTYSSWHKGYRPCRTYEDRRVNGEWRRYCTDIQDNGSRRPGIISTLSDWTFKSWATELQPKAELEGTVAPLPEYTKAPDTETFKNPKTGKTATLKKYWNPRYNPATWAHMTTFTIGFSSDSLPSTQYRPMGSDSQTAGNIGKYWNEGTTGAKNNWGSTTGLFYYLDGPTKANNTNAATNNGNSGNLIKPSSTLPYGYDGSFADYAAGRAQWFSIKQETEDMWHAAINGRGQFYAVEQGEDLKKAFEQIVRTINDQTASDRGSTATSGSNASQTDVGIYMAKYDPDKAWKGEVAAELFKTDGSTVDAWGGKTTADKLDAAAPDSRVILTSTTSENGGVAFRWADNETYLSTAQKALLTAGGPAGAVGTSGQNRVNYLRGSHSLECPAAGCTADKPFRKRVSRQGDIVNSEVWYVGAPASNYALEGYTAFARTWAKRVPMIYVGGNDGMLHGFKAGDVKSPKADDGSEALAYIPRGVMHNLPKLTAPAYNENHLYFVDGSPMTGDVFDSKWKTLLVGTLGAGGRGYFVLDVTNPGKTDTGGSDFSEANAGSLVVMDKTLPASTTKANDDAVDDLGHIFAKPVMDDANPQRTTQIVRLNNNRWAVVMGNGYNSANGRPVLLIQYLDGSKELLRIPALATDTDNGLSAPRLVDISGDGIPDVVYAGDLKGNLWKFLINTANPAKWGVAAWEGKAAGTPLFTAKNARSITAAPSVRVNDRTKKITEGGKEKILPVGGMMVAFGTGRNVTVADRTLPEVSSDPTNISPEEKFSYVDTLYSVLDNTRYQWEMTSATPPKPTGRVGVCTTRTGVCNELVKEVTDLPHTVAQTDLVESTIPTSATSTRDGKQFWKVNHTDMDWAAKKGWYLDFPEAGERLLKPMQFYDGSNLLTVASQIPASGTTNPDVESCEGSSAESEKQFVTFINIMDGRAPRVPIIDGPTGLARFNVPRGALTLLTRLDRIHVQGREPAAGGGGTTLKEEKMRRMPEMSIRPNWRQLR